MGFAGQAKPPKQPNQVWASTVDTGTRWTPDTAAQAPVLMCAADPHTRLGGCRGGCFWTSFRSQQAWFVTSSWTARCSSMEVQSLLRCWLQNAALISQTHILPYLQAQAIHCAHLVSKQGDTLSVSQFIAQQCLNHRACAAMITCRPLSITGSTLKLSSASSFQADALRRPHTTCSCMGCMTHGTMLPTGLDEVCTTPSLAALALEVQALEVQEAGVSWQATMRPSS